MKNCRIDVCVCAGFAHERKANIYNFCLPFFVFLSALPFCRRPALGRRLTAVVVAAAAPSWLAEVGLCALEEQAEIEPWRARLGPRLYEYQTINFLIMKTHVRSRIKESIFKIAISTLCGFLRLYTEKQCGGKGREIAVFYNIYDGNH